MSEKKTEYKTTKRELPKSRLLQPVTFKWFMAVFGFSLAYSIMRYHIAGNVEWTHFPLYIFNKTISLSAVIFVALAYLVGRIIHWHDHDRYIRLVVIKFCGLMGFFLAAIHASLSLALLSPAYFAKYFALDGRLNFQGELAIVVGVLGLFLLLGPALSMMPMMPKALGGIRWKRNQRLGYVSLMFVSIHLITLGYKGWLNPSVWNGGLPPISLLAIIIVLTPLIRKYSK